MTEEPTIEGWKNYGLNLELERQHQTDEDWIFGATGLTCIAEIPEGERESYLPRGEIQRGLEDFMDCVTRGALNLLETKFNYLVKNKKLSFENELWLREKGYLANGVEFSDRFVAINSGTTREGNSMKAPLEAIRKQGLIPKSMLPAEKWMRWEDYHDPAKITQEMKDLGMEFTKRFFINYERIPEGEFRGAIKKDMMNVAGYAWPNPVNGVYPLINYLPNHAFLIFKGTYSAFDNYIDPYDGDYIKRLAPDYNFSDLGYRVAINKEEFTPKRDNWIIDLLKRLGGFVSLFLWKKELNTL